MKKLNRRKFLASISGLVAANLTGLVKASNIAWSLTPTETEGPFYPLRAQKDKDLDLTRIKGESGRASGRVIVIELVVRDQSGKGLENVQVDLWQANAAGRYRHSQDKNKSPLDPFFQGWAIVSSDKDGKIQFKTVFPGVYPASNTWNRPPHIHFKISKPSYGAITTQMYFPSHPLNEKDLLLQRKTTKEKKLMISTVDKEDPDKFYYNVVLQKDG